jgi:hypothetical protein
MRKLFFAGLVALALSGSGCSYVTSGQPSSSTVSGESWYVNTTTFLGLAIAATIYHCPKETPTQCTKASMQ